MTKDEAIRLALAALVNAPIEYDFHGNPMDAEFGKQLDAAITELRQALEQPEVWTQKHWTEYERSIAAAENEACAKVCEVEASVIVTNASEQFQEGRAMGAVVCAEAIRARMK